MLNTHNGLHKPHDQSFEEIYHKYYHVIYDYIFMISRDSKLSEDIAQDSFLKLWEKGDKLSEIKNVKAYMYTIAKNLFLDQFRRSQMHVKRNNVNSINLVDYNSPEAQFEEAELNHLKNTALMSLNEVTRNVYILSREKSFSYQKISEKLGISKVAVKKRMIKALEVLRNKLKPHIDLNLSIIISFVTTYFL